jgi:hypothetical protein
LKGENIYGEYRFKKYGRINCKRNKENNGKCVQFRRINFRVVKGEIIDGKYRFKKY